MTLATFPSNALTEPTAVDRHDASPATLRRAVAFIDEHARQDITVADPALETVTAVALRWGFPSPSRFTAAYHREYGVTPSLTLHRN